jgi:hypothetical protein
VKIDVEGAGVEALCGMEKTLANVHPHVFIEPHDNAAKITDILRNHGYTVHSVSPKRDEHPTVIDT